MEAFDQLIKEAYLVLLALFQLLSIACHGGHLLALSDHQLY